MQVRKKLDTMKFLQKKVREYLRCLVKLFRYAQTIEYSGLK